MESESGHIITQLGLILLLTGVNAFFASAEMAIVSVNKNKIRKLSEEGNKKANLLIRLMEEPSHFLSAIQIGITLAGFFSSASAATGLSGYLAQGLERLGIDYAEEIAMIGITLLLSYFTLVLGELVPKRIALKKAEGIALFSIKTIYVVSIITKPFIKILALSTSVVLKLLGLNQKDIEEKISEEEIKTLIYQSEQDGCIDYDERKMIDGVFEFNDKVAKEIMTPRKDTFSIDIKDSIEEVLDKVLELNYSRIPVYEEHIDNVIGILYIKDLIKEARKSGFDQINLRTLLHEPYFIPETKKINELFKGLKKEKKHLAILVDEYGGVSGIVTMEDLVEEIMGDIHDEYDIEEIKIKQIDKAHFIVKGSVSIHDLKEEIKLTIEEGEYDTLNGYLLMKLGKIPEKDVTLEVDNIVFRILKVSNKMIEEVQIQILSEFVA